MTAPLTWGDGGDGQDADMMEYLYGIPVGIVGFRDNGTIEFINPLACNLILPTLDHPVIEDIYDCLRSWFPCLAERVAAFRRPGGVIVERTVGNVTVGPEIRIYSLFVNRVKRGVNVAVIEDVTDLERMNERLRQTERLEASAA